jgi:hypothetical protein
MVIGRLAILNGAYLNIKRIFIKIANAQAHHHQA